MSHHQHPANNVVLPGNIAKVMLLTELEREPVGRWVNCISIQFSVNKHFH